MSTQRFWPPHVRRRAVEAFSAAAIVASCSSTALARPCGQFPANHALADATLVVKGRLESTVNGRTPESDSISVIRIDRILKGATARTRVSVTHFLCGLEYSAAMRKGRPLIAFVTASGSLLGGTAVLPASTRSAAEVSNDATANLRAELVLGSADRDPIVARAAIGALAELDGDAAVPTLRRAAQSADFGVRVRALSWLIQFGDVKAFREFANTLSKPPFSPFAIPSVIHDDHEAALAIAYDDVTHALRSFAERDVEASTAAGSDEQNDIRRIRSWWDARQSSVRRMPPR